MSLDKFDCNLQEQKMTFELGREQNKGSTDAFVSKIKNRVLLALKTQQKPLSPTVTNKTTQHYLRLTFKLPIQILTAQSSHIPAYNKC